MGLETMILDEIQVGFSQVRLQEFPRQGVTHRRMAETDPDCVQCDSGKPTAGQKLLTSWGKHVLVWENEEGAVMLQTDEIEKIKPISCEKVIACEFIPGGIEPTDVFRQPQAARLIHIGFGTDKTSLAEIKARAGVDELINIPVDLTQNPWAWDQFEVEYERQLAEIRVFPVSGDKWLSAQIENPGQEGETPLFIRHGKKYFEGGGVVKWSLMKDAYNLCHAEMQRKYPRSGLYLGKPEDFEAQVARMSQRTHIQFTDVQRQLYVNLRLIPSGKKPGGAVQKKNDSVYYNSPEGENHREEAFPSMHPIKLGEIGLVGETLKFTQDTDRIRALQNYLRIQEFIHKH